MASLIDKDIIAFCVTIVCIQIGALIAFAFLLGTCIALGELLSI